MIATTILLAGLAIGPLAGPSDCATVSLASFDPQACGIAQATNAPAPPDDVNAMVRRLVDILDLAEAGEEEAALKQSNEAGLAVASFRDTG